MPILDKIFNRNGQKIPSVQKEGRSVNVQCKTGNNLIDEKAPSPTAIIYQSELDYLSQCVLDYPNIETGGQLFGFWSNQGVPVVLYVIGPGRNANHQKSFFNQDTEYLMSVGNELLDRYGLCHIGEWHSHHQLGLARPSGHDARTMHHGLMRIPQRRLLLCICNYENGCSTANPYNFHENDLNSYTDAQWQIIPRRSPFREIADMELKDILIHPQTSKPRHGSNRIVQEEQPEQPSQVRIPATYWVAQEGNLSVLKDMLNFTRSRVSAGKIDTQADESGIVQFHIEEREVDIRFPKDFPKESPEIYVHGAQIHPEVEWYQPIDGVGIFDSYKKWLNQLTTGM
ncbi:Mov34/MPN/PAD-1 family protein [Phocaeicola sartorii]|uniref:Mov34/MPN/PAD-1 family protein n=1 Tax=Phocaeicola sartorii TaxID=671267 RepID=UPI0026328A93|nr:hypothetical protein [Phocaeicola sartorii]